MKKENDFSLPAKRNHLNRTERLYKIQKLLESRKLVHISDFLRTLEVSRATFRRDLEYLRDRMGAPIEWDREANGYFLAYKKPTDRNTTLPGLWFSEREVYALLTMLQMLSSLEPNKFILEQIEPIRARLNSILEAGVADGKELIGRVKLIPVARRLVNDDYFQRITGALIGRKRLDIVHHGRQSNAETRRQISPQQLIYYRDNWYLDAFCHMRDDLRSFSIDSILDITVLDKTAVSLPADEMKKAFESTYGIFAGTPTQKAKLRFTPFRARWVSHEVWHPGQSASFDAQGHYVLELPFDDDRELVMDILRQGPDCEVLEPPSLRNAVAERLAKTLSQYRP